MPTFTANLGNPNPKVEISCHAQDGLRVRLFQNILKIIFLPLLALAICWTVNWVWVGFRKK